MIWIEVEGKLLDLQGLLPSRMKRASSLVLTPYQVATTTNTFDHKVIRAYKSRVEEFNQ